MISALCKLSYFKLPYPISDSEQLLELSQHSTVSYGVGAALALCKIEIIYFKHFLPSLLKCIIVTQGWVQDGTCGAINPPKLLNTTLK